MRKEKYIKPRWVGVVPMECKIIPWSAKCWAIEFWNGYYWQTLEFYTTLREAKEEIEKLLEGKV